MTSAPNRAPRFLLVEDNDAHARLIMRCLADAQLESEVVRLDNGEAAMDFVDRKGVWEERLPPDLVILDLRLPRYDGHEVLAHIRRSESLSKVPVVVLTTSEVPSDRSRAEALGIEGYLVKPVNMEGFQRMVRELGRLWWIPERLQGA